MVVERPAEAKPSLRAPFILNLAGVLSTSLPHP